MIAKELYPVVFADKKKKNRFSLDYVTIRSRVMQCVGYDKTRFRPLVTAPDRSAIAKFVVVNGAACAGSVSLRIDAAKPDFFLGSGLLEFTKLIWPALASKCPAAKRATVTGYVEAGSARVYSGRAVKAGSWRLDRPKPSGRQTWFLKRLKAAYAGNAKAQTDVAVAYEAGQATSRNLKQAVTWYERAAKQGDPFAQAQFGWLLANGKGITTDMEQAIYWTNKSAEQGNPIGIFNKAVYGFPWYDLSRFSELIRSGNLVVGYVDAIAGVLKADQVCSSNPYNRDPRYLSPCAQIKTAVEIMKRKPAARHGPPGVHICPGGDWYGCNWQGVEGALYDVMLR
ncbi:MAG: sel1 repeat family protein [Alphaproteobacteria bacterium]|nr:sel1 repeat family protein [Alphaproteobacteria bacterium]